MKCLWQWQPIKYIQLIKRKVIGNQQSIDRTNDQSTSTSKSLANSTRKKNVPPDHDEIGAEEKTAPNEIYLVKQAQSFQYGLNNIRWIVFNEIKSALFAPKYQYWNAIVFLRFYFLLVHTVCWSSSIKSVCAPLVHLENELKHYFYRINTFFNSNLLFRILFYLQCFCHLFAHIYINCTWFLSHLIEELLFTKQKSEKNIRWNIYTYAYISLSLLSRCMSQN